jgi:LPPG:FO 2-phospho-L-lactate transferase
VTERVLALAGGVGGAKLALGLVCATNPQEVSIVVNTGDDDVFHGLYVCPDVDTVMYTLSGLYNTETGWGIVGDTFQTLSMLGRYGSETWFNLGDQDFGTHIRRTDLLAQGMTLSEVTQLLCRKLGLKSHVIPMTNERVGTVLQTETGDLPMQNYFVQKGSSPRVTGIYYDGIDVAQPSDEFVNALDNSDKIILCPSNPFLSLGPILALRGVRDKIRQTCLDNIACIAVSPIVGGQAIKGPAAKIMRELGYTVSCVGVAELYKDICNIFVMDQQDSEHIPEIEALGMRVVVAQTIMNTEADKIDLAKLILELDVK